MPRERDELGKTLFDALKTIVASAIAEHPPSGGKTSDAPLLVTIEEAANRLRVSPSKVKQLIARRILKTVAVDDCRRIPVAELERYVFEQTR